MRLDEALARSDFFAHQVAEDAVGFHRVRGGDLERVPALPNTRRLLEWVYVGRVVLAMVVFVAASFYFRAQPPEVLLARARAASSPALYLAPLSATVYDATADANAPFEYEIQPRKDGTSSISRSNSNCANRICAPLWAMC